MKTDPTRRHLLQQMMAGSVAAVSTSTAAFAMLENSRDNSAKNDEPEVTATEDLMREHGVIRRALLVYAETVPKLRAAPGNVDPAALRRTAQLFRTFGEDYHEKMLEEQHIFPTVRKTNAELAHYTDILIAQHARGREITDYILALTNGQKIGATHAEPLAKVFDGFVRMYENHAAREDTIVFPSMEEELYEQATR